MADERLHESAEQTFENAYLGRGWAFPVRWRTVREDRGNESGVEVQMTARVDDIFQSIQIVLETVMGERVMRPKFGSTVHRFVFSSINTRTKTGLEEAVRKALLLWERRITGTDVRVTEHPGHDNRLDVEVSFDVDTHRMRHSRIFPFYVNHPEGQS